MMAGDAQVQAMNITGTGNSKGAKETPKRVSGGLVLNLKAKKKKRRIQPSPAAPGRSRAAGPPSSGVPGILSSIPRKDDGGERRTQKPAERDNEFGDDAFEDGIDVPSDALLCLQAYTRSSSGAMAETCAYCPIFTSEEGDGGSGGTVVGACGSRSTHAAPFLPRHLLIHLLDAQSSNGASSPTTHIEQEIKRLASDNKIRLLQLHGTAAAGGGGGGGPSGWRGDGNDDEDVAVMETSSYLAAAEMALRTHFEEESPAMRREYDVGTVHSWLASVFLPYFAGRTWVSIGALDAFCDRAAADSRATERGAAATRARFASSQTRRMTQRLVRAGLLLPRRGVGPAAAAEGHWLSLPGLGRAARSVADGRAGLLRRLRSSRYGEKKRSVLEHEIGRLKRGSAKRHKLEQAGKFVVLDVLAKGWASIHTTCAGEQFVRLAE